MIIVDAGCEVRLDKNKGYVLVDTIKVNVVRETPWRCTG
jgi:biotin operon repressor